MKFILAPLMVLFSFTAAHAALKYDKAVPSEIVQQFQSDLTFVSSIQGSSTSSLHQRVFGSVSGSSYMKFFNARINMIGLNNCGGGGAVACFIPSTGRTMWLTSRYTGISHPQIARLMVIFHEARHAEYLKLAWAHATCPTPFLDTDGKPMLSIWTGASLAGEPACDKTPIGSYGSSMIMLKNISENCSNCTDKVKMDAGIFADDQLKRIIDPQSIAAIKNDLYQGVKTTHHILN